MTQRRAETMENHLTKNSFSFLLFPSSFLAIKNGKEKDSVIRINQGKLKGVIISFPLLKCLPDLKKIITNQVSSNHYGSNGIERRKVFFIIFKHTRVQEYLLKKEKIIVSLYSLYHALMFFCVGVVVYYH